MRGLILFKNGTENRKPTPSEMIVQSPGKIQKEKLERHQKFLSGDIKMLNSMRSPLESLQMSGARGSEGNKIHINFNIQNLNVYSSKSQQPITSHLGPMGRSASDSGLKREEIGSMEKQQHENKFVIKQSNRKLGNSGLLNEAIQNPVSPEISPKKRVDDFSNSRVIEALDRTRQTGVNPQSPNISLIKKSINLAKKPVSLPSQSLNSGNQLRLSGSSKNFGSKTKQANAEENHFFRGLAVKSKAGCSQMKMPKVNQDSFIFLPNFDNSREFSIFGILDGHGMFGHQVSQFVKATLPKFLESALRHSDGNSDHQISSALTSSFLDTLDSLLKSPIDSFVSGTTAVVCLITKNKIFCANAGDSRAVMVREDKNNEWSAEALSEDHKPDLEAEKTRILQAGGRVEPFRDFASGEFIGPARVWLKKESVPGLAMSRSIGDLLAARVGVTANPEVKIFNRQEEDRFLLIASDGLWEFFSNEEVMKLAIPYFKKEEPEALCDKLIRDSNARWMVEDDVIDDTTVVAVCF